MRIVNETPEILRGFQIEVDMGIVLFSAVRVAEYIGSNTRVTVNASELSAFSNWSTILPVLPSS